MELVSPFFKMDQLVKDMGEEFSLLLQYWTDNSIDIKFGGFVGERDFYNQLVPGAEKGAVLNARILWSFSAAYNFSEDERYLKVAYRAYHYLIEKFWDKEHGGLYWAISEQGEVVSDRKQIYAQGFGIYGFSEFYKATGDAVALEYAQKLFELIEAKSYDEKYGGYVEALSREWNTLDDMRLSDKDANEPKSMNTHLHILEPYTNLYRVWKDEHLKQKIEDLIDVFDKHIINQNTAHFELFFDYDWTVKSSITSYGHDIEGAWLLYEAAYELGNAEQISKVKDTCIKMVDATINEGMVEDGSVFNEKEGDHLDADKHWWPQAEAMVGLAYAWKITGEEFYLHTMIKTWKFIKEKIIDKQNGEWHWRVDQQGNPITSDVKLGFWKCPYHNSRALMEVMTILNESKT
ncbi:AGE family epimerase/isomerase [Plebeiibacterium sediminum]|uniref:Cellobiose 2-epimerase n=1 Tax=Plebeiibacterium sediminum TaxID=2992112 RepID=A0AAE3SE62_9BACT|nr:AGE family epimerase/isomerase [Plebeiobacterium sediminum]MCW3785866.1 AGE family epimerase/isomerase [Plebeiobacterium sediminum]